MPRTTVLPERQRQLLAFLDAFGGRLRKLDFQKLLFLFCQESPEPPYEFVPYRFGAFSFTCYNDRRKLVERGLLAADQSDWELTEPGRRCVALDQGTAERLQRFAERTGELRGDALVAESYVQYPYYATRSSIAARVLAGKDAAIDRIALAGEPRGSAPLATIGYEGRTLERYLNILLKAGVTLLCDVRRNALSRKYGFSKSTLSNACEGVGLRYEHLPDLGIASDARRSLKTQADYDHLFDRYRRKTLPEQDEALSRIHGWIDEGHRVALTCYERLPAQCHRGSVAEALERQFGDALRPRHL